MKKIFEVFVRAGKNLSWDSCNEPVFEKVEFSTERKCYVGENWKDAFVQALADLCNNEKQCSISWALIGRRYNGDEATVHEADAGRTVYIPVSFTELFISQYVFGIYRVDVDEDINGLKVVPEKY